MSGRAVRSRLQELRQARDTAQRGREVLEQKLELLRRELQRRTALRNEKRTAVEREIRPARAALVDARIELGRRAVESAALAQAESPPITWSVARVVGVEVPRLDCATVKFQRTYGPGGTSASLDEAGARFAALLPVIVALATEEVAVRGLHRGLQRTARRLNALEKAILPGLNAELRELTAALEEEEREDSFRRKLWSEAHRSKVA